MDVKSRHHLRSDEVRELEAEIADRLGVDLDGDSYELVELTGVDYDLVLVDGEPAVVEFGARDAGDDPDRTDGGEPFLTVRGANAHDPTRRVVTVDAGAIEFVSGGADVMRPGIVEADDAISEGDLVAIDEESHGKFLAVGRALTDGDDMLGDQGKVVESIHHVGDDLYEFSV